MPKTLPEWRRIRGITQSALASPVGVTRQAISQYEIGKCIPDIPRGRRIASVLKVSLDDVIFPGELDVSRFTVTEEASHRSTSERGEVSA